jgi:hypothetical protein
MTTFRVPRRRAWILHRQGGAERLEVYDVLNSVQFQDVDRTARFDPAGVQINPNFGTAIGIANPTRPTRVIQMSLRFTF